MDNMPTKQFKNKTDADFDFHNACERIIDCLSAAILAFDTDFSIIKANKTAFEMVGPLETNCDICQLLNQKIDTTIWGDWHQQLAQVITKGRKTSFDNVAFNAGNEQKLLEIKCSPVYDQQAASILGGVMEIQDITKRVNIERQLDTAERQAAVGKIAGKVAHELNNPMDGILRYINLTLRILQAEKLEKPVQYLKQCKVGLTRMVQIISELLEFSRNTYGAYDYMALEDIINDALHNMEHKLASANVQVKTNFAKDIPAMRCANLFQVFCNLIKNSIDAMDGQGELLIETVREKNSVVISFSDTGPGIDEKNINSIFEPFYTTKNRGQGTGLGLAICRDIVSKYKGTIDAENREQGGSRFIITLPIEPETGEK